MTINHERHRGRAIRLAASASCLAGLLALAAGCGSTTYAEKFDSRLSELQRLSPFSSLTHDPTDDLPVNFRVPASMTGRVYNLYSVDPVDPSKYAARDRVLPPFMLDGVGFRRTYEGKYQQTINNSSPYFLYVWMFNAPRPKDGLEKLRDLVRLHLRDTKANWEPVEVKTPEGKTLNWQKLHFEADQTFVSENGGSDDPTKAIFELWYFESPGWDVLLGWRATEESWDKAKSGDVKVSELPPIVAGTVTFSPDQSRNKKPVMTEGPGIFAPRQTSADKAPLNAEPPTATPAAGPVPPDNSAPPNRTSAEQPPSSASTVAAVPSVKVTVSKETTYITEPLRADGYVDYIAALNQSGLKGITPENNAAVLLWKALGPKEIEQPQREEHFKLLGIPSLPDQGDYFVPLEAYLQQQKASDGGLAPTAQKVSEILQQFETARGRAWSRKEFPELAAWLAANERPLALAAEASLRPRYFEPRVADSNGVLFLVRLPLAQNLRAIVSSLSTRAMLRSGEGDSAAAWDDLLACHRLAHLASNSPTLIESVVSRSLEESACSADQGLLKSGGLSAIAALKMRDDLTKLTPMVKIADAIDIGERFMFLDSVEMVARGAAPDPNKIDDETLKGICSAFQGFHRMVGDIPVDWNLALRMGNPWFDRAAEALRKPTRAERVEACLQIDRDLKSNVVARLQDAQSWAEAAKTNPTQSASERSALAMVGLLLPAIQAASAFEDRAAMQLDITKLGFALAAYHTDRSSYPTALAELAPKYIDAIPKDVFNGEDLHYKQDANGCVVYSVGINGTDDNGKGDADAKNGEKWDDLVVRIPSSAGSSGVAVPATGPAAPGNPATPPRSRLRPMVGGGQPAAGPSPAPAAAAPVASGPAAPPVKQGPVQIEFADGISGSIEFPAGFQQNGKSPEASTAPPVAAGPAGAAEPADSIKIQVVKLGQGVVFNILRTQAITAERQSAVGGKELERGTTTVAGQTGDFIAIAIANPAGAAGNAGNDAPRKQIIYLANIPAKHLAVKITADMADASYKTLKEELKKCVRSLKFD